MYPNDRDRIIACNQTFGDGGITKTGEQQYQVTVKRTQELLVVGSTIIKRWEHKDVIQVEEDCAPQMQS